MINLTQFEVAGKVWAIECPTDKVCNLIIQVVSEYADKTTESFITVKLFGGLMAKCTEQCIPGEPVRVTGKIKSREYNEKPYNELIVNNLFCTQPKATQEHAQAEPTVGEPDLPF